MEKGNAIKWTLVLVAVLVVGFGAMKIFGSFSATKNVVKDTVTQTGEVKEFNIKAFRFGYTPDEIVVNKGDKIKISIDNTDTLHGMRIPELGISGNNVVEFVADKSGEFIWYCNNMCGTGHGSMSGKLVVQ